MRPLRLQLSAFGPYSRSAEIDFRRLGESGGIFLIHGQTGAGKTSILDGLCFALFGSSSGADRDGESMRSDLAPNDLPTEVTLEFALGPDIYRIVRRPRQRLKKKRDEGLTQTNPTAALYKLHSGLGDADIDNGNDSWSLLASGAKNTDALAVEFIGMTADQFRQVVVLPQGQFRKFLSAPSDAREKLLEILFRTERYRRISDHLAARAQELEANISAKRENLGAQLQSLEIEAHESLAEKISALENEAQALKAEVPLLEERFKIASERMQKARLFVRLQSEKETVQARFAALDNQRGEIENIRTRLEAERRSRPVLVLDHRLLSIERDLAALKESQTQEENTLALAEKELARHRDQKETLEALKPELESWRTERTRLLELHANAKRLKESKERLGEIEKLFSNANQKALLVQDEATKLIEEQKRLQGEVEALNQEAATVEAVRAKGELLAADLTHLSEGIKALKEAEETLGKERSELERHKQAAEEALKAHKELKLAYHLSQAALLAQELKSGEPCPVCGSTEHPTPAHMQTQAIGTEDIDEASQRETDLQRLVTASVTRLEAAEKAVKLNEHRLLSRFPGAHPIREHAERMREEQLQALNDLKTQLLSAEEAKKKRDKLTAALKLLEAKRSELEKAQQETLGERDEARAGFESARGQTIELEASVPEAYREPEAIKALGLEIAAKIKEREKELEENARLFEAASRQEASAKSRLKTLKEQFEIKTKDHVQESKERARALATSGFTSLEECRAAGLSSAETQSLEDQRRRFDTEWATITSRLQELKTELESLPDWAGDLGTRMTELETADSERSNQKARLMALTEKISLLKGADSRLTALQNDIQKAEERYRSIGRLASVAQGQLPHNPARVNFSRFVLAARLDEVLEQASRRLYKMSRGQFILKRATGQEDRRRSAGLDLEVEDAFSGTSRATASFSGGEGFMASLALALGLADVVQSRLGGVRLETVFVDEGFGTLDSETLELAMKTLSDLQAGGRLVGVISHVPELREQISKRLVVRKAPTGSTIAWEGATIPSSAAFT